MNRTGRLTRKTAETTVEAVLGLDGGGEIRIDTGVPFFDHMLHQLAAHGFHGGLRSFSRQATGPIHGTTTLSRRAPKNRSFSSGIPMVTRRHRSSMGWWLTSRTSTPRCRSRMESTAAGNSVRKRMKFA